MAKVRDRYASRLSTADDRVRRAEAAVTREQEQASESKLQAGVSVAATIFGALLGRKAVSTSTLGRATTAARGYSRAGRAAQDVVRAEAELTALRAKHDALAEALEQAFDAIGESGRPTMRRSTASWSRRPAAASRCSSSRWCGSRSRIPTMRRALRPLAAGVLLLAACGGSPTPPPFKPVADVKQLMASVVEPAAEVYWDAVGTIYDEHGVTEIAPGTLEEWAAVRNAAFVVTESGNLLMMSSRARDGGDWMTMSQAMIDVGVRAIGAADARNSTAVFDAGAELYDTCTACHAKYDREIQRPNYQAQ